MDFAEIETFLMIVQTKSITKTAENLFLSQPTISHRLKALENELNMELITRKKGYKSIELTMKGEEFIPIAERWMYLWKETKLLQHGKEKLFLSVGCIDTLSTTVFAPFYSKVLNDERSIDLRIKTHQSYELYSLLENHEIDIGFVYHHLYFKNIISEPVITEKMYLIQDLNTTLRKREIHTDELNPDKELFFSWETNYQIWHDRWINNNTRPKIQVDTFALLGHLFQNNQLWLIAPVSIVKEIMKLKPVYISKIVNQPPERVCYKITHKYPNSSTQKAVALFEEKLQKYISQQEWGELEEAIFDE